MMLLEPVMGASTTQAVTTTWPKIVCPEDGATLRHDSDALACPLGHRYAVTGGIPRMVPRDGSYADAFGLQWRVFRRTQLDSHTGAPLSLTRARRCIGAECWATLHERPAQVLEVGCGAGRFTEVLLATGARVTSVDLSSAVEANLENFPASDRHRVLQADALRLPFAEGQFDLVFCLGVIQHTPNPEETIAKLYAQVRHGGWLVIDHYTWDLSNVTKVGARVLRPIFRRMPPERALVWTRRLVKLFLPLHRAVRNHRAAQALLSRVSPLLTYYHTRPLSDEHQEQWAYLDTYDSLTDWHKHHRTRGQIRRALERLGGRDIWCAPGVNGVEARARRP